MAKDHANRPPVLRHVAFRVLVEACTRAVDHLAGRGQWWTEDPETVKRDNLETLGELERALDKADRVARR